MVKHIGKTIKISGIPCQIIDFGMTSDNRPQYQCAFQKISALCKKTIDTVWVHQDFADMQLDENKVLKIVPKIGEDKNETPQG